MTFADAARTAAALAAQALGWTPDAFWAATPADLRNALGTDAHTGGALDAGGMAQLMEAFPDG